MVKRVLLVLTFAWISACSDPLCEPLEACDVTRRSCQRGVMDRAACYLETEPRDVKGLIRVRTVDELREEHERELADSEPPEPGADSALWRTGLSLLGLALPAGESDEEFEHRLSWRAAYYEQDADRVTLVDRGWLRDRRVDAVLLLTHELVHALQAVRDDPLRERSMTTDAWLAASAMKEGEADLVELLAGAEGHGFSLADFRPAELEPEGGWTTWGAVPALDAYRTFVHRYGIWWAGQAWHDRGPGTVAKWVHHAPESTRHVMAGYGQDDPVSARATEKFAFS